MAVQGPHGIAWTDRTWNPIRGCSRVSRGCDHCYAMHVAHRFSGAGEPYDGLTRPGPDWTGKVAFVERQLEAPMRWRRASLVFVNSMSDLFHPAVKLEWLDQIFAVMALSGQHRFQILTKRPARQRDYWNDAETPHRVLEQANLIGRRVWRRWIPFTLTDLAWPLQHVWPGVSVEDQPTADLRLSYLHDTHAPMRWVSYEPALMPVDFRPWPFLNWLVIGGESGILPRPFDLEWARAAIRFCRDVGAAPFMKQLGARAFDGSLACPIATKDRKGGNMDEWPEDLRVREYPKGANV